MSSPEGTGSPETPSTHPTVNVGPGGHLDLYNAFTYHPPTDEQVAHYEHLRKMGRALATQIANRCPASPERTIALNKVREAVMWANAAIACHTPAQPETPDE